jgi:hypothetical protein
MENNYLKLCVYVVIFIMVIHNMKKRGSNVLLINISIFFTVAYEERYDLNHDVSIYSRRNIIPTTKIRNNYGAIQSFIFSIYFSLLLLVKLSFLIFFASFLVSVLCFFFDGFLKLWLFQLSR